MTNERGALKKNIIFVCIFAIFSLILLSTVSPSAQPLPGRDQGVFLMGGRSLLQGGTPYRDFWDHKGPLIYFIEAGGLGLSGNSYWGVWLLEVLFLASAIALSFLTLQRTFGPVEAFWGTMVWLAGFGALSSGGNTVEEFALPLQFAQIYLLFCVSSRRFWIGKNLLIGLIAGLAFLLRPNIIGIFLSILLFSGIEFFAAPRTEKPHVLSTIALMLAGFAAVQAAAVLYFLARQALGQFLDSVFTYNFLYSAQGRDMWGEFMFGLEQLPLLPVFAVAGWIVCAAYLLFQKEEGVESRFVRFVVIALPIEILLSLSAGRDYEHYFIAWLPVMGLLAGFFASSLTRGPGASPSGLGFSVSHLWLYGLLLGICFLPAAGGLPSFRLLGEDVVKHQGLPGPNFDRSPDSRLIATLMDSSSSYEYVQVWGNEEEYNFILNRKTPSRFGYITPLLTPSYATEAMSAEFLKGLQEHQPLIVIDAKDSASLVDFPAFEFDTGWNKYPTMNIVIQYLRQNYRLADQIGSYQIWVPKNG